jgi:subtilisin family serine protease
MFNSSQPTPQLHGRNRCCGLLLKVEQLESRDLPNAAASGVPGELLVSFKSGVSQAAIGDFYARYGLSERAALDQYARDDTNRLKLVSVPVSMTEQLIAVLERDPRVAYAEPNYVTGNALMGSAPTDPSFFAQQYLHNTGQFAFDTPDIDIDAPEAWEITTGSPDVLVAVIGNGFDFMHPDLAANIWTNPFELPADGIDNDGNGYVDDVHGYDFVDNDGDPMNTFFHDTAVAGVIGATAFNEGVVGVAWRVGMVAVRIISDQNIIRTSDIVRAFQYVNFLKNVQGQNIVATNNSWGWYSGQSQAIKDAMAGIDQPGMSPILHVCSAGNEDRDNDSHPMFPASYDLDNIISVAATDRFDHYADWRQYGYPLVTATNYGATSVDLAAQGDGVFNATSPLDQYAGFIGSSFAAPQVTGAAVLVWSAFPSLTAEQVKQRILAGVDPIGQIGDNYLKPTVSNGRLNVANALAGASLNNDHQTPAAVSNLVVSSTTFPAVTLDWTATGDDGSAGRAAFYDVRYSTAPITNRNWDVATRALREPGPKPAGAAESFTIWGLDPSATYYFALKVRDEMGNESRLSNLAAARTGPAEVIGGDKMENGANGWVASGLWHQSFLRSYSPVTSWYYGREDTRNYDTGSSNSGTLTSPIISLTTAQHPLLIYKEWREVEDFPIPGAPDADQVQIGTAGNKWDTVFASGLSTSIDTFNFQARFPVSLDTRSTLTTPQWVSRAIDLSDYVGKTIQIRFAFDTLDDLFNNFEGWYVDDVIVYDAAIGPPSLTIRQPSSEVSAAADGVLQGVLLGFASSTPGVGVYTGKLFSIERAGHEAGFIPAWLDSRTLVGDWSDELKLAYNVTSSAAPDHSWYAGDRQRPFVVADLKYEDGYRTSQRGDNNVKCGATILDEKYPTYLEGGSDLAVWPQQLLGWSNDFGGSWERLTGR